MSVNSVLGWLVKILLFLNLVLVIIIVLNLEINWIGNMVIYISPSQVFVNAYSNEIKPVTFKIETQSNYPCIVECEYYFVDTSSNEVVENGTLRFSRLNDSVKRFEIQAPLLGTGQKVYTFSIECTNRRSVYCWFRNEKRRDSAIAFLTYRLKEEEESVKLMLKNNLQEFLVKYSQADIFLQSQEITISDLGGIVNFDEINEETAQSQNAFASIRNYAAQFTDLWNGENYSALQAYLNDSVLDDAAEKVSFIGNLSNRITGIISRHNETVQSIETKRKGIRTSLNIAVLSALPAVFVNETNSLLSSLNEIANSLKTGNFTNYSYLREKIKASDASYKRVKVFSDANLAEIVKKGYVLLNENYDSMCSIKGYCTSYVENELSDDTAGNLLEVENICINMGNLDYQLKDADRKFVLDYYKELHPGSAISDPNQAYSLLVSELSLNAYADDPEFIKARDNAASNRINSIKNNYIRSQNEISGNYNKNITELNLQFNSSNSLHANETLFDYCSYLINLFNYENSSLKGQLLFPQVKYACNDFLESLDGTAGNSLRNISSIKMIRINNEINHEGINIINDTIRNMPEKYFLLMWNMTQINDSQQYISSYCSTVNRSISEAELPGGKFASQEFLDSSFSYAILKKYNITTRVNTTVGDPQPTCCVFGECSKCCVNDSCRNEPSLFPVIMIHGHAFDKEKSPTFSFDIFDEIEADLQNDGYVYSGTVFPNINYTGVKENELGSIRKPVSIKATYYIDFNDPSFNQSELNLGLENYSARLNDIVNFVRFKTGKSKVNIIAHSMGGLIARRYLQVYGEDSVSKLILIASPNHGISESVKGICLLTGREKECYDVTMNSTFINKVNSIPLKNITEVYNVYGTGCETDKKDGDKVVTASSAILEGAKNYEVNGSCSGVMDFLHLKLLNTDLYPETYNIIRGILKSGNN